jgi:hypothetical protein
MPVQADQSLGAPASRAGPPKLKRIPALESVIIDKEGQDWISTTNTDTVAARVLRQENRTMARVRASWKQYSRLVARTQSNTSGEYCVQCDVISHDKQSCELEPARNEAYSRCIKSHRACSKVIKHENRLMVAYLPLPASVRGDARWDEIEYWTT